jgi:hypothetical protein
VEVDVTEAPVSTVICTGVDVRLASISNGLSKTICSPTDVFFVAGSTWLIRWPLVVGPALDRSLSPRPTSSRWLLTVTLTLKALFVAGVLAPNPGVRTVPGVRTDFGVLPAGVRVPEERAVPERRDTRGVGASVSSTEA